jgi:hypothetical protein
LVSNASFYAVKNAIDSRRKKEYLAYLEEEAKKI